jgi:Tfp pilus assembly protein PilF
VYYVAYKIRPSLAGPDGNIIYEKTITMELEWSEQDFMNFRNDAMLFADHIPIVPGNFTFTVRIENNTSRTISHFSTPLKVSIPRSGIFEIGRTFLSYDQKGGSKSRYKIPFNFFNYQFTPSLENSFTSSESVSVFVELYYPQRKGVEKDISEIRYDFKILDSTGELKSHLTHIVTGEWLRENNYGIHYISRQLPVADLPNGEYTLEVTAQDSTGAFVDKDVKKLIIEAPSQIIRPNIVSLHNFPNDKSKDELLDRGNMLVHAGHIDAAIAEFKTSLRNDTESIESAIALAKLLMVQHKHAEALEILKKYQHVDPNNRELVITMAKVSHAMGDTEQAIAYYRRLMFITPDDVELLNDIGSLLVKVGKTDEAIQLFNKSLELNSEQPAIKSLLETLQ